MFGIFPRAALVATALVVAVPAAAATLSFTGSFERAAPTSEFSAPGADYALSFTIAEPQSLDAQEDIEVAATDISNVSLVVGGVDVFAPLAITQRPISLNRIDFGGSGTDGVNVFEVVIDQGSSNVRFLRFVFNTDTSLFDIAFVPGTGVVPVFGPLSTPITSGRLSVCTVQNGNCTLNTPETVADVLGGIATVAVVAVPEPASWMLMVAGFGFAGIMIRRARRGGVRVAA